LGLSLPSVLVGAIMFTMAFFSGNSSPKGAQRP
jgi:hypothetical protein